jgi:hypothetical protein
MSSDSCPMQSSQRNGECASRRYPARISGNACGICMDFGSGDVVVSITGQYRMTGRMGTVDHPYTNYFQLRTIHGKDALVTNLYSLTRRMEKEKQTRRASRTVLEDPVHDGAYFRDTQRTRYNPASFPYAVVEGNDFVGDGMVELCSGSVLSRTNWPTVFGVLGVVVGMMGEGVDHPSELAPQTWSRICLPASALVVILLACLCRWCAYTNPSFPSYMVGISAGIALR